MDEELMEELDYEIELLIKSGFYSVEDILEIIEDEFIDEEIDIDLESRISDKENELSLDIKDSQDFLALKDSFNQLIGENNIVCIHNAGFDIEDGIQDAFELNTHLLNNKFNPEGFAFYSFEDVETAIYENKLSIAFGDFSYDKDKCLEIGKLIAEALKMNGFKLNWCETIDEPIIIEDFNWQKTFDDGEYFIEGAFEDFVKIHDGGE